MEWGGGRGGVEGEGEWRERGSEETMEGVDKIRIVGEWRDGLIYMECKEWGEGPRVGWEGGGGGGD